MNQKGYLQTGQVTCHDTSGKEISCIGSGQDAEFRRGIQWPHPRFKQQDKVVLDCLTGLFWTHDANISEFPMMWQEALDYVSDMNKQKVFGYADWRLPNRRELRSLISHQTRKPALPEGNPFTKIFLGWYWTSTTAAINPGYAWYIHMEGARMFYGHKKQYYLLWPVRGEGYGVLPATGQTKCYDSDGRIIHCTDTGQDGEFLCGSELPATRFEIYNDDSVVDHLTGLCWLRRANLTGKRVKWDNAFTAIEKLNSQNNKISPWKLPNINELESLVDSSMHSPALPAGHPFSEIQEGYWSSTTSMFEPDWAWALYLTKGAVGVGQKWGEHFYVWAVRDVL